METNSWEAQTWPALEPHGEMLFREISPSWTSGWSVEEAEVAAQDRTIWKIFTSRAASAYNA